MNNENKILSWLKTTDIPLSKISKKTGISRKSLYNWQQGHAPTFKSLQKLNKYYSSLPSMKEDSIELTNDGKVDAQYIINLQAKQIESLERERLKKDLTNTIWEQIPFDITTEVKLSFNQPVSQHILCREVKNVSDLRKMSKKLGYTLDELRDFWSIGIPYVMTDHPLDNIISKSSKTLIRDLLKNFVNIFEMIKMLKGDHYMPINLSYIHKKGYLVPASVFNKIIWKEMLVFSKVQFL